MASGEGHHCPECRAPVGGTTGTDPYKHTLACFHLPDKGSAQLLAEYEGHDDERSQRIVHALRQTGREE